MADGDRLLVVSVAHNDLGDLDAAELLERMLGAGIPGTHIVVKLHPQDRSVPGHVRFLRALARAHGAPEPAVSVVRDIDIYRLLRAADAHLGEHSTVLTDAVVANLPNMIAVGQAFEDALGYVAAGVAVPVSNAEDVRRIHGGAASTGGRGKGGLPRRALQQRGCRRRHRRCPERRRPGRRSATGLLICRRAGGSVTRTVAIIQARTGSTRLPGKVLLPLLDEPVLVHVVRRVRRARTLDAVVVATTVAPGDDPIAELGRREGWPVTRGSEMDLLDRYLEAARAHAATHVVRITSDCPLIDPGVIDDVVTELMTSGADYVSNSLEPRTFPRGLDTEAMTLEALERAGHEDADPASREHATPYIYRHPEQFRLGAVRLPEDLAWHRWTLDTPEDYELIRRLYDALGRDDFGWRDALTVALANPDWEDVNRHVQQKLVPRS